MEKNYTFAELAILPDNDLISLCKQRNVNEQGNRGILISRILEKNPFPYESRTNAKRKQARVLSYQEVSEMVKAIESPSNYIFKKAFEKAYLKRHGLNLEDAPWNKTP